MATAVIKAKAEMDTTGFKAGIASMKQGVSGFASGQLRQMAGMLGSAFAVGAVVNFARRTGEAADDIQDMSQALGVTAQELQTLQLLAQRTGSSAEAMASVLKRAAIEGVKFEDVAKVMRGAKVEGVSTELALKVMGKTGAELNNVLDMIAKDGLVNLQNELLKANQIMTNESVNAAAAMQESWEKASASISNSITEWTLKGIASMKRYYAFLGAATADIDISINPIKNTKNMYAAAKKVLSGEAWEEAKQSVSDELSGSSGAGSKRITRQDIETAAQKAAAKKMKEVRDNLNIKTEASDTLGKIGGIAGGQTSPLKSIMEANLEVAKRMEKLQEKMADNTEKTAEGVAALNAE